LPIFLIGQQTILPGIHYDVEQGMLSSEVYCVLEDENELIWFGTDAGISRFNGYEFTNFTPADGLSDNSIFALQEDEKGRIWYLPFNGRIGYIANDIVYPYEFNRQIQAKLVPGEFILNLIIDTTDNIQFVTSNGALGKVNRLGNVELISVSKLDGHQLVCESGAKKTFAYMLRSDKYHDKKLFVVDSTLNYYEQLSIDTNGSCFFYYPKPELLFFNYGNTALYKNKGTIMTREVADRVTCMSIQENGSVWVAIRFHGMSYYETFEDFMLGHKPVYTLFDGVSVSGILAKENGSIWVCLANDGVHFLRNENIKTFGFEGGKARNRIRSICKNDAGEIFYANKLGEMFKIDTLGNHSLYMSNLGDVTKIHVDANNHFYISVYEKKYVSHQPNSDSLTFLAARDFTQDKNNDIWNISRKGVEQQRGDEVLYSSKSVLGFTFFQTIFQDNEGKIWAGGNEGLFCFQDQKLEPILDPFKNEKNVKIKSIDQLNDGTLVVGTASNGVFFINTNSNKIESKNIGFDNFIIEDIHIDEDQDIWMATNRGIVLLNEESRAGRPTRLLSQNQGLPSSEIASIFSFGQTIYAATNEGLVVFNKRDVEKNTNSINLFIESVMVNEQLVSLDSNYSLKSKENYIEFSFIGLSYRNPGNVQYSYKLEGIDEHWQYTKSRNIRYPSLSPNQYVFKLKAANEDGVWCDPLEIRITINPPFWKKTWFIALCILFIALIVLFFYQRIKKNRLAKLNRSKEMELQKRRIIEAELRSLRAQMNPHFTFNTLNSIQNFITNFDQEKAQTYISSFSMLLRKVLENSRYRFITIEEEIKMLQLYIDLENLRFDETMKYEFKIDERIDIEFQEIPSMILQPFVENAILHGISGKMEGEKKLTIEMILKEDHILCIVEDTGIGREKSAEIQKRKEFDHKSLGTKIANERLLLYNEEQGNNLAFEFIDLYDNQGRARGTRVEICFAIEK
jgi:ligand-binding sensor domain-containing protein